MKDFAKAGVGRSMDRPEGVVAEEAVEAEVASKACNLACRF